MHGALEQARTVGNSYEVVDGRLLPIGWLRLS